MLNSPYSPMLIKPMVQHVRYALLFLSFITASVHAQVSIDTAREEPRPASKTMAKAVTTNKPNANNKAQAIVLLPQPPKNPLPYCDDISSNALKEQPKGSTLAASNTLKGSINDRLILNGQACIVREDMRLQGDKVEYDYASEQVTSTGNAVIRNNIGDVITGKVIDYNLATETGKVSPATYSISATEGRGKAESLEIISSRRALMQDAYYTTCRAENPDWYIKNSTLSLDQDNDVGTGTGSVLIFKNLPILATPYMQFPLGNKRRSGFLTPTMGISSSSGFDLTVPYYFNIAPNYDLTIYPGVISKRGPKLGAEYRYLTKYGSGNLYGNFVSNDRLIDRNRYYWRAQHISTGELAGGTWQATVDAQRASDQYYIDDISTKNVNASDRILPSEYALQYNKGNWQVRLREKTNQTLQDSSNSVSVPYDFEPQLTVTGFKRKGNWVSNIDIESTHFTHPNTNYAQGWRHIAYPSIRYEYRTAAGFITPKIGINASQYDLSRVNSAYDKKVTRVLPIASIDSGLIFERSNTSWLGRPAIQTLEPRLYYLYAPYRDQSKIWNFDSTLADFDLSHIYGENIFTGRDRISQDNQVTLGISSRWLAQDTGAELFQVTAAQRHYFSEQHVTLPGGTVNTNRKSDLLLAASGQVGHHLWIDTFAQYNFDSDRVLKSDFTLRWQPGAKKVFNIGYHKNSILSTPTRNIYASAQWPLTKISKSLYGVARLEYDLANHKVSDALIGFEYAKDCWIFRIVADNKTSASTNKRDTSVYFQLELKGLGALGNTTPSTRLNEGISGYEVVKFEDNVEESPTSFKKDR